MGLNMDSLIDVGYPGVSYLGDIVCSMDATKIDSKNILFFFRSYSAKDLKWGGAKHRLDDKDDGRRMHLWFSFKEFLEVVKRTILPWETVEIVAKGIIGAQPALANNISCFQPACRYHSPG
jgi:light-regulated signal transduction histidine kinase (bacteriophytochrome)